MLKRTSHATSHLWIESPDDHEADDRGRRFNDMFSTHPPLSERINLLREMEGLRPKEGPDLIVSEALRMMQDDRTSPESVAAAVESPGTVHSSTTQLRRRSISTRSSPVSARLPRATVIPTMPVLAGTPTCRARRRPCATGTGPTGPTTTTRSPATTICATPRHKAVDAAAEALGLDDNAPTGQVRIRYRRRCRPAR